MTQNEENIIELIKSKRTGENAIYENYIYNLDKESGLKRNWRCVKRDCTGRLHSEGLIVKYVKPHNHSSSHESILKLKFNSKIKNVTQNSSASSTMILNDVLNSTTSSTIPQAFNKKKCYTSN
jgi:hypothetical protein